jgi:porin
MTHLFRPGRARRNRLWRWSAAVLISLLVAARANAQLYSTGDLQTWLAQPTMTGDWGGLRPWLLEHGINLQPSYVFEVARNTNGLHGVATDYVHQLALIGDVDLGRLGVDPGGNIRVLLTERTGRDLGPEKLGSLFQTFEVFGQGRNVRLSIFSLEQELLGGRLNVKGGFFPISGTLAKEFSWLPEFGDFITNAHHPVAMPLGSGGWDYFPTGHWGARIRLSLSDELSVQTAIHQVNPTYFLAQNGFKIDFQGNTGIIFPLEVTYQPRFDPRFPGMYKVGGYFDTSKVPDQFTPEKQDKGREGYYFEGQQKIYSEPANPVRGLTIAGYYAAGDENTALLKQNYHLGLSYQGTFPTRDLDTVNIGWFTADINPRLVAREKLTKAPVRSATEHLLEINYGAVLARWLQVRPALQYVVNPGNLTSNPNAWVFLLRTQVTF